MSPLALNLRIPPYLEDTFSIHFEDEHPTTCGVRLVTLARSLAAADRFDPTQVWTLGQLLDLMLAALTTVKICEFAEILTADVAT
jgi:hypothetical protein